jgi:hypothetical protein
MARSAAGIQAEITQIETYLASADSLITSASSNGASMSRANRQQLEKRLDSLYIQLGRANGTAPMFTRGRVRGLRD